MNNSQHSKVWSGEETKSEGRMNAKTVLSTFPHNFQLNKTPSNNLLFWWVELDDFKELDSTTHNNDDNLTNNNLNTKAEFMSILGESKEGL